MSPSRDTQRNPQDARDLVATVYHRSLRELELLARAERARILGDLIAAAFTALGRMVRYLAHLSRTQLARDEASYRARRNLPIRPRLRGERVRP